MASAWELKGRLEKAVHGEVGGGGHRRKVGVMKEGGREGRRRGREQGRQGGKEGGERLCKKGSAISFL